MEFSPEIIREIIPVVGKLAGFVVSGLLALTLTLFGAVGWLARHLLRFYLERITRQLDNIDMGCHICRESLPDRFAGKQETTQRLNDHDERIRTNTVDCEILKKHCQVD